MNLNGNFDIAFQTFSINNIYKEPKTTTKVAFFKRKINIAILYKKIFKT